ncbi:hypothetical protein B9T26_08770 [Acinetobacter sp. ANC 4169]|uniref:zinc ribbon domain-containing protein n=1 Tax=Acinetobacter sp. ANC 4169 TaxID=1977879 RepID=UPI000A32C23F|nr:zinc ribbon domain-containing protein [Acinetobacter sp. ANC 4169]OTG73171.1 hypothetical protein B9T26_08770 [Acinetobacter sp. ANC 4169]
MPLIPCRSCNKPLSPDAKICPNCGAKKPTKYKKPTDFKRLAKLFLILIAVYFIALFLSKALNLNSEKTNAASNEKNEENLRSDKCLSLEESREIYLKMQEMVSWDENAAEPIIATFKSNYWNDSFPTKAFERQQLIDAIANTDSCLKNRKRTIYIFDSKGKMVGRASPKFGIEYLYLQ